MEILPHFARLIKILSVFVQSPSVDLRECSLSSLFVGCIGAGPRAPAYAEFLIEILLSCYVKSVEERRRASFNIQRSRVRNQDVVEYEKSIEEWEKTDRQLANYVLKLKSFPLISEQFTMYLDAIKEIRDFKSLFKLLDNSNSSSQTIEN